MSFVSKLFKPYLVQGFVSSALLSSQDYFEQAVIEKRIRIDRLKILRSAIFGAICGVTMRSWYVLLDKEIKFANPLISSLAKLAGKKAIKFSFSVDSS